MNRPTYSAVAESTLDEWLTDNLQALVSRYVEWRAPPTIAGLFLEFCRVQYDEQKELDAEPLDEWDLRAAEGDVEDGWFNEPDGECFRGGEAAAYLAETQARIQRELK